jgi:hypothetical protein
MIHEVAVSNYLGESAVFKLTEPEKSGFYVAGVDGLGPPPANINTTEMATADGAFFNSARTASRNIVLTLGFMQAPTVEAVRHLSYKYFPIKTRVRLTFRTDARAGEIFGYVETNEPNIFSERQLAQISVICPDPYFYDEQMQTTIFEGVEDLFEFPFSNESLDEDLIEMGALMYNSTRTVLYAGDAEIGVTISISIFGPVSDFVIFDPERTGNRMALSDERLAAITGGTLGEGDRVVISTARGMKRITLTRKGVEYNILNALNRDAYWFQLHKGDNLFSYSAEHGVANLTFRIENRTAYEGV